MWSSLDECHACKSQALVPRVNQISVVLLLLLYCCLFNECCEFSLSVAYPTLLSCSLHVDLRKQLQIFSMLGICLTSEKAWQCAGKRF